MADVVYTAGHSTRGIDELVDLLQENGVRLLLDVRRFPVSRRYPHFTGPAAAALRGYADHMATRPFHVALARLEEEARSRRPAVMCAEADPQHCHRQLLADALVVKRTVRNASCSYEGGPRADTAV
jgi:uncharacterized protein (DUF488 family)